MRVGSRSNTPDHKPSTQDRNFETNNSEILESDTLAIETSNEEGVGNDCDQLKTDSKSMTSKKIDINAKVGSHLDKLDSLITKAENAQYSMQHQTKQMKKFINK